MTRIALRLPVVPLEAGTAAFAIAVVLLFFKVLHWSRRVPAGLKHPPSPPGAVPILGHSHIWKGELTSQPHQSQLVQWSRQLGDIFYLRMGFENWFILGSPQSIKEVFDRHGAVTGTRDRRVANDFLSGGNRVIFMPYSKKWRSLRAIIHKCLNVKSVDVLKPSQDLESRQYLNDILTDPQNFLAHVKRYTVSVLIYATYGFRVLSLDDKILHAIFRGTSKFGEVFATRLGISDLEAAWVAGSMIEAGSDTTQLVLNSIILGLVSFPEVVRKAQAELDTVVGNRMPEFSDFASLPYIRAIVKEALRWRSPTNGFVRHNTITFNPDRFLETRALELSAGECISASDVKDRDHFSFGAGRRVCPGYNLAENSLLLLTSRLLWGFNVKAWVDPISHIKFEYDLWNYSSSLLFGPNDFPASFTVRSVEKERIIRAGITDF
ncbi:hypothetical protein FE257_005725 [Aspergillus nanangensis]|uniref:Cytochrome P450 n=1 Tax=Aspergillus nanangensis TaxID=2582783 RepID=A0AAD4GUG2_ASPNN|nr:hypothetical protein FE257_005725 [Aspergillus nanangensis]